MFMKYKSKFADFYNSFLRLYCYIKSITKNINLDRILHSKYKSGLK